LDRIGRKGMEDKIGYGIDIEDIGRVIYE